MSHPDSEQQFILRFPASLAEELGDMIKKNTLGDALSIKWQEKGHTMRQSIITFKGRELYGIVYDLPTIIESQKTLNNNLCYKVADISQILIVTEENPFPEINEKLKLCKKDPKKRNPYIFNDGLTPPLKDVRKRRFRKTHQKRFLEQQDIENEVDLLLREDDLAFETTFEMVDATMEEKIIDADFSSSSDEEDPSAAYVPANTITSKSNTLTTDTISFIGNRLNKKPKKTFKHKFKEPPPLSSPPISTIIAFNPYTTSSKIRLTTPTEPSTSPSSSSSSTSTSTSSSSNTITSSAVTSVSSETQSGTEADIKMEFDDMALPVAEVAGMEIDHKEPKNEPAEAPAPEEDSDDLGFTSSDEEGNNENVPETKPVIEPMIEKAAESEAVTAMEVDEVPATVAAVEPPPEKIDINTPEMIALEQQKNVLSIELEAFETKVGEMEKKIQKTSNPNLQNRFKKNLQGLQNERDKKKEEFEACISQIEELKIQLTS